jgi:hypothetical protein
MSEGQATAIIVLLAIPCGLLVLMALVEWVVLPIRARRERRRWEKGESLRKCEARCSQLEYEVKALWSHVKPLTAKCFPPAPTKPARRR